MASVYNRGTRGKPKWYIRFKDTDGKWKSRPSHQPTKALAQRYAQEVESQIANGALGIPGDSPDTPLCSELIPKWLEGLQNRDAKSDRSRGNKWLLPKFGPMRPAEITLPVVMLWIDDLMGRVKKEEMAEGTARHTLNLLSRFFGWAVERGHATVNPVRLVPTGKRPRQAAKKDAPWLDDDDLVRKLVNTIESPINLMFYLGNRSGARTGEIAGFRLSDFGFLSEGVIRARYSYDGPLKEDKALTGKVKWIPAADDCEALISPWLDERRAAGAGPEDLLFPSVKNGGTMRPKYIVKRYETAAAPLGITMTWKQATRHSFTSRLLAAGASLDEVSAAIGHSSPEVTKRYYDHYIRRTFSSPLRAGLGLGGDGKGKVVPMRPKRKS